MVAAGFDRCLRGHERQLLRGFAMEALLVALLVVAGLLVGRPVVWVCFASFALLLGVSMAMNLARSAMTRRFRRLIATAPDALAWIHTEPVGRGRAVLELFMADGEACAMLAPADIASALVEHARVETPEAAVTLSRTDRDAKLPFFDNEVALRLLEAEIAAVDSPLSRTIAPRLSRWTANFRDARAALEPPLLARVQTDIGKLAVLFEAARNYEANRGAETVRPAEQDAATPYEREAAALLDRLERVASPSLGA